jgi:two-component system, OmpR family, alkaline phosphatase synthesis response regulator PhoP
MERILIVEDNHINYLVIEELLSEYAVTLYWAKDGNDFFRLIQASHGYNLVLMDLMLPDTDGIELTKHMLNNKIQIPVVFISAYSERCEEIFDLGVEYFLSKPILTDLFFSVLSKFVVLKKKELAR